MIRILFPVAVFMLVGCVDTIEAADKAGFGPWPTAVIVVGVAWAIAWVLK